MIEPRNHKLVAYWNSRKKQTVEKISLAKQQNYEKDLESTDREKAHTLGRRAAKYLTYSRPMFFTILSKRYSEGSF